jgi:hypothetical protein
MTSFPWRIFFTICALSTTPRATSSSSLKLKDNVLFTAIDHSNDEKMSNHFDRVVSAAQQFTAPTLSAILTTPEIPSMLSTATEEKTTDAVPLIKTLEESTITIPTAKPTPSPSFKPVIAVAVIQQVGASKANIPFFLSYSDKFTVLNASLSQDFLLTNVSAVQADKDKQYKSFTSSSEAIVFTALKLAGTEKVYFQRYRAQTFDCLHCG